MLDNENTLGKIQKYLHNKHKFDRKLDTRDLLEQQDILYNDFKAAIKSNNSTNIRETLGNLLVELLKYSNTKEIDWTDLLKEKVKLNF